MKPSTGPAKPGPSKPGPSSGGKVAADGRKIGENKLLTAKSRWQPYTARCQVCKQQLHQEGVYCQSCAYRKGLCAMCGKQILDVKNYKQSTT